MKARYNLCAKNELTETSKFLNILISLYHLKVTMIDVYFLFIYLIIIFFNIFFLFKRITPSDLAKLCLKACSSELIVV